MIKGRIFSDVKDCKPSDYFHNHFCTEYLQPPIDLKGAECDIWKKFTSVECRLIHHLVRVYPTWRDTSAIWFQKNIISEENMTELQLWVVTEKPDFGPFLEKLNTHFFTKEKIYDGIDKIHEKYNEPMYINAFESSCYFFLLARCCFSPEDIYPYYNSIIKATECYGQFKGWVEIVYAESLRLEKLENSSKGGKKANQQRGTEFFRNELVRILTEKVENSERYSNKVKLSENVAPALYTFMTKNESRISIKSKVSSAEELAHRIHDWSKRNTSPYEEIYSLAGKLIC